MTKRKGTEAEFIEKLWKMVEDHECDAIIAWSKVKYIVFVIWLPN